MGEEHRGAGAVGAGDELRLRLEQAAPSAGRPAWAVAAPVRSWVSARAIASVAGGQAGGRRQGGLGCRCECEVAGGERPAAGPVGVRRQRRRPPQGLRPAPGALRLTAS